jgi:hypothetical protein
MGEATYGIQVPAPRRHGPAYGDVGPPPNIDAKAETAGPLDRPTEAILAVVIVTPALAGYAAIGYGLHALASGFV